MSDVLVVTGTGTEVGKTVVTAALAAAALAADRSVAVLKPAQTGLPPGAPGDVHEVARLNDGPGRGGRGPDGDGTTGNGTQVNVAGVPGGSTPRGTGSAGDESRAARLSVVELARFPEPLAPATAARRAGMVPVSAAEVAEAAGKLAAEHDLVLVEGAGGLLVRLDDRGDTLADAARMLAAPVLTVVAAGLGTLNAAALTAEALRGRGVAARGVVIGSWPAAPDLAARCNLLDFPEVTGGPLLGAVPAGAAALTPAVFRTHAPGWLAPALHGTWDATAFTTREAPPETPRPASHGPGRSHRG
ncbi:ATP-dependent dethiobiotin synthetase BioD [Streptomyces sp. NPDC058045]|uniref:ATP-dependent dethiobiotin synthetase BioD n=1 Tax=Streptomyces sp. NPDC058045 TaxID=3346311 RepID=UPI0036E0CF27